MGHCKHAARSHTCAEVRCACTQCAMMCNPVGVALHERSSMRSHACCSLQTDPVDTVAMMWCARPGYARIITRCTVTHAPRPANPSTCVRPTDNTQDRTNIKKAIDILCCNNTSVALPMQLPNPLYLPCTLCRTLYTWPVVRVIFAVTMGLHHGPLGKGPFRCLRSAGASAAHYSTAAGRRPAVVDACRLI